MPARAFQCCLFSQYGAEIRYFVRYCIDCCHIWLICSFVKYKQKSYLSKNDEKVNVLKYQKLESWSTMNSPSIKVFHIYCNFLAINVPKRSASTSKLHLSTVLD